MAAQVEFGISCARVDSIVKRLFDGYLATHTCALDPRLKGPALTPYFVSADFNGDRVPDLAVAAWPCISPENRRHPQVPFRLLSVLADARFATSEAQEDVDYFLKVKPSYHYPQPKRFLIILHGSAGRDFEDTPIQDRRVVSTAMLGVTVMTPFYGTLKAPVESVSPLDRPPPKESITGILLVIYGVEGEVIYWNGTTYRWYSWSREDY